MTTNIPLGTAKIYQFPRRAAALGGLRRHEGNLVDPRLQQIAISDFGSWYHQAAVEADRVRKP